jgi:hypothetical protein
MTDNFKNNNQLLFTCSSGNYEGFIEKTISISRNISNSSIFISCQKYDSGLVLHPTILNVSNNSFTMIVSNKDSDGKGSGGNIDACFNYIIFFNPTQLNYLVDNNQLIYSGKSNMGQGTSGVDRFFSVSNYNDYKCFVMPYLENDTLEPIDNIALYIKNVPTGTFPGFYAYGHYKDGRGERDGGGLYNHYYFWIAIHNNIIDYKKDGLSIIKVGNTTTSSGSVVVTHNLNTDNYFILLTPIRPVNHINNFYYNLQYENKGKNTFTVISFERDGSDGQHGGFNNKSHPFNWAVIRNN